MRWQTLTLRFLKVASATDSEKDVSTWQNNGLQRSATAYRMPTGRIGQFSCWRHGYLSRHGCFRTGKLICRECLQEKPRKYRSTAAARILAVVLAVLAFSGLFRWLRVEKWLALIIGIFILLAPWAFGVTGGEHEIAVANEVVVGALVCVASLFKPTARGPIVQPI